MCEFHHRVAMAIAENPDGGGIDLTRYSLASVALASFWIERLMPDMGHLTGNSNHEMATPEAQAALEASIPDIDLDRIRQDRAKLVPLMRVAIDDVIADRALDLKALNLPKNLLGFRRPLNLMLVELYEGPTDSTRTLVKTSSKPEQEPMRKAMEQLLSKPGVIEAFESLINDSIAELMMKAPAATNPRVQQVFNLIPRRARSAITECAVHGGGGALATHMICLGGMVASGGAGAALMGPAMYAGAPAVAMGIETYMNWRNGAKATATRLAAAAAISFGIAAGINQVLPHDHDHMRSEKAQWFETLPPFTQQAYLEVERTKLASLTPELRDKVREEARTEKISPELFLMICDGTSEVGMAVNAFLREKKIAVIPDAPPSFSWQ